MELDAFCAFQCLAAKAQFSLAGNYAKQGKAIVVLSSDFPEIYKVADSCMVLYKGRVNAVMRREEMTEKNVMYYSTGANVEGAKNA